MRADATQLFQQYSTQLALLLQALLQDGLGDKALTNRLQASSVDPSPQAEPCRNPSSTSCGSPEPPPAPPLHASS